MTIPAWALPLLLTVFVLVLGFAWRLATRAENLTDKLQALVERLATMETRLAAITVLEGVTAELRAELRLVRESLTHERELRERDHDTLLGRVVEVERRSDATPHRGLPAAR